MTAQVETYDIPFEGAHLQAQLVSLPAGAEVVDAFMDLTGAVVLTVSPVRSSLETEQVECASQWTAVFAGRHTNRGLKGSVRMTSRALRPQVTVRRDRDRSTSGGRGRTSMRPSAEVEPVHRRPT